MVYHSTRSARRTRPEHNPDFSNSFSLLCFPCLLTHPPYYPLSSFSLSPKADKQTGKQADMQASKRIGYPDVYKTKEVT